MLPLLLQLLLIPSTVLALALETAPPVSMPTRADMVASLARSDMVWSWNASAPASVPELWTEAPFVGNGMVGAYVTVGKGGSELHIEVSRADYWDVRLPGTKYYADMMYHDTPRLPGGFLTLAAPAAGSIVAGSARIHLANASMTMTLSVADAGGKARTLSLTAVALADRPTDLLLEGSALGALNTSWTNRPANGNRGVDPHPNPAATCAVPASGVVVCKQDLLAGGGFAMARKLSCSGGGGGGGGGGGDCTLLLSLTNSVPAGIRSTADASTLALTALHAADARGPAALKAAHTRWWLDEFWPRSILSVPDAVVEAFHTIQLYKVGSATRCDSAENCWAMDLAMPWYVELSRWHDYHWDLNVQMSYWLVLPSNHARLGNSLVKMLKRNLPFLIQSVPLAYQNDSAAQAANTGWEGRASCEAFLLKNDSTDCFEHNLGGSAVQLGDLPWVAHNLWWQYRYSLDPEALEVCVSVLKRAIGYYLRLMTRDSSSGALHLPLAESPEYASANDTNYDLALFRWGVGVLLHVANTTQPALKNDPAYAKWRMVKKDLTPFPTDAETGLLIGEGVELAHGHRHWSHLFSMFPTTLLNPGGSSATGSNTAATPSALHSPLALQSLDHYAAMNGAGKFVPSIQNGFPRAAIATMSGQAGRADAAYRNLSNWFLSTSAANSGYGGGSFAQNLGPNTMYQEANGAPCNESPLGAAFAIQSWLLSSWRFGGPESALSADAIRVFQAVPSVWRSAVSIGDMSAEGGYNVSGSYTAGKTDWVHLTATALGEERQVELYTDMPHPLVVTPASVAVEYLRTEGAQQVYSLRLSPTQAVLLQPAGATPAASVKVAAVAWPPLDGVHVENYWGKHQRTAFPPMPPPPPPPPPPRPHPPHPAPAPAPTVTCKQTAAVPGFTCYDSHCAYDGPPVRVQCGNDICHPANRHPSAADQALCVLVDAAPGNASATAAARCDAHPTCQSFGRCPEYPPRHCNISNTGESVEGGAGVCFKYFEAGKAGLTSASGWTMWVRTTKERDQ